MGGRYIVSLVFAHGLLIIWGYAVGAHTSVVSETATLLTQYPDVLMATVAGFLLLGVGIVSMRAARRRVRYETWYYLHLYTYLAIALAFSHQFAVGASFVEQPGRAVLVVRDVPDGARPDHRGTGSRCRLRVVRQAPFRGDRGEGGGAGRHLGLHRRLAPGRA